MASSAKQARHDGRFEFSNSGVGAGSLSKPIVLGSELRVIEPNQKFDEKLPTMLEYDVYSTRPILTGPQTRFRVKGGFFKLTPKVAAADPEPDWTPVTGDDEYKSVLVSPNWFEMLIKTFEVFYNHDRVTSFNESRGVTPYLNTFLYHYMDPKVKKLLYPQAQNPIYCTPAVKNKWEPGVADNEAWKKYSKQIFTGDSIQFDFTPFLMFPFHQNPNHWAEAKKPSKILPLPSIGHLQVRIYFVDEQSSIFRTTAANKAKYKFSLQSMDLIMEEARLPVQIERQLYQSKKMLTYPGVSRIQMLETLTSGAMQHKVKFQNIHLPEALLIFAIHKNVPSGTFSFAKSTQNNVFLKHNIQSIEIAFDQKTYHMKDISIGSLMDDKMDIKTLLDHLFNPPMGVSVDHEKMTLSSVSEGAEDSPYPHVYISLCPWGNTQTRVCPYYDDNGSVIGKKADLDLTLKFKGTGGTHGSTTDATYIIYAIWTNVSMIFDPVNHKFNNPYSGVMLTHSQH